MFDTREEPAYYGTMQERINDAARNHAAMGEDVRCPHGMVTGLPYGPDVICGDCEYEAEFPEDDPEQEAVQ